MGIREASSILRDFGNRPSLTAEAGMALVKDLYCSDAARGL